MRAGRTATPQAIAHIRHELGLDQPIYTQFYDYMKGVVLHFDLGYSYYSHAPVKSLIAERLPATISLAAGAIVIWLLVGLSVGIVSAVRRRTLLDRTAMGTALVFISAPEYWLGLLALFLFASDIGKLAVFPGAGSYVAFSAEPVKWFTALILPWLVLAASFAAVYARLLRGSLIEVLGEDYIRTARAKGLAERRVVMRHGVRSAITPIVTVPRARHRHAARRRAADRSRLQHPRRRAPELRRDHPDADFPIVQGTVLLAALFIVVANLLVDISYAFLDPRVRFK